MFGHHPVSLEASLTTTEPIIFDLDPQQAMQLEALYAATPGVFLHHAGHTHRNKRTLSTTATDVVFQEVAAVKEYPGGFHLLRVFTGGYALNFYKFRDTLAQEWSERSRQEYGGWRRSTCSATSPTATPSSLATCPAPPPHLGPSSASIEGGKVGGPGSEGENPGGVTERGGANGRPAVGRSSRRGGGAKAWLRRRDRVH